MLDLVPEATKGPTDGRNGDHMALVLSIVYNSTELTLADIQKALAASKPSDEVAVTFTALIHAQASCLRLASLPWYRTHQSRVAASAGDPASDGSRAHRSSAANACVSFELIRQVSSMQATARR